MYKIIIFAVVIFNTLAEMFHGPYTGWNSQCTLPSHNSETGEDNCCIPL